MSSRRRWGVFRGSLGVSSSIFAAALCLGLQPLHAGTVIVQPIRVCDVNGPTYLGGANCGDALTTLYEQATEQVWAQAGISIDFLTTEIADTDVTGALDVNTNTILDDLFDYGTYEPAHNDPLFSSYPTYAGNLVITLWIVPNLDDCGSEAVGAYGCGEQPGNEIAIGNNVFTGSRLDTIAHEMGHNLGLSHCEDVPAQCDNQSSSPYYLMDAGGDRSAPSSLSQITPAGPDDLLSSVEIGIAQESPLDRDQTPEPATAALTLFGVGIFWMRPRNRRK
jgi:hypothetical protein